MVCSSGLLTRRQVILAKLESICGTDSVPVAATDALLVGDPVFNDEATQLERNILRDTLSRLPTRVGREVARFQMMHEIRNNGNTDGTTPPKVGVLLQACGMSETQITGTATIGDASADAGNTGTVTWAKTTAYAGTYYRTFTITCTTPGASGVAEVSITAPAVADLAAVNQTGVTVTDATPISLTGGADAEVTPTVGVSLLAGDEWTIIVTPAGYLYKPVSSDFESATLYNYLDGTLAKITGAMGTFSIEAAGGEYGSFSFDFTGNYIPIVDAALPTDAVYEDTTPPQVELANLTVTDGGTATSTLVASRFGIDIANTVSTLQNINQEDAYLGVRITGRNPTMGMDPEMELVADYDFYGKMSAGTEIAFEARVGTTKGNTVIFTLPNIQYSGMSRTDRDGITAMDITGTVTSEAGDDEIQILFA